MQIRIGKSTEFQAGRKRRPRLDLSALSGRFGRWSVIAGPVRSPTKCGVSQSTHYSCRCDCGTEQLVRATHLVHGNTRGCARRGCRPRRPRGNRVGALSGSVWCHVKRGALLRAIPFQLTQEQAWDLFVLQSRRCALTGRPLAIARAGSSTTASLDRIDSSRPYTLSNVQWVHKEVNLMKRTLTNDQFRAVCADVVGFLCV